MIAGEKSGTAMCRHYRHQSSSIWNVIVRLQMSIVKALCNLKKKMLLPLSVSKHRSLKLTADCHLGKAVKWINMTGLCIKLMVLVSCSYSLYENLVYMNLAVRIDIATNFKCVFFLSSFETEEATWNFKTNSIFS